MSFGLVSVPGGGGGGYSTQKWVSTSVKIIEKFSGSGLPVKVAHMGPSSNKKSFPVFYLSPCTF